MKKHFSKNLIISKKEEHLFQQSNSCEKLTKYLCHVLTINDMC